VQFAFQILSPLAGLLSQLLTYNYFGALILKGNFFIPNTNFLVPDTIAGGMPYFFWNKGITGSLLSWGVLLKGKKGIFFMVGGENGA